MMKKVVRAKIRVKIKSLAEEVVIIRKELSKHKFHFAGLENFDDKARETYATQSELQSHLDLVVKRELRHTLVAYAYLKKMPYRVVENKCKELPKASTIKRIIKSLSSEVVEINDIQEWLDKV